MLVGDPALEQFQRPVDARVPRPKDAHGGGSHARVLRVEQGRQQRRFDDIERLIRPQSFEPVRLVFGLLRVEGGEPRFQLRRGLLAESLLELSPGEVARPRLGRF